MPLADVFTGQLGKPNPPSTPDEMTMPALPGSLYTCIRPLCLALPLALLIGACGNVEPAAKSPGAQSGQSDSQADASACGPATDSTTSPSPGNDGAADDQNTPGSNESTDPASPCSEQPDTSDDSGTSTPSPDDSDNSSTDPASENDPGPSCDRDGFSPAVHQAGYGQGAFRYQASSIESTPFDAVFIDSFFEQYGGPSTSGTYQLAGFNYADCGLCLLATLGCTSQSCDTYFFADEGSLEITSFGQDGQPFTGTMHDVVFREVTIDPQTYQSTPVDGGQIWCMDGYSFNVTVGSGNVAVTPDPTIDDTSDTSPTTDAGTDSGSDTNDSGSSTDNGSEPTPSGSGISALGNLDHSVDAVNVTVVASRFEGLNGPTDLEFNPLRPGELWIVNQADNSTTILFADSVEPEWLCNAGYFGTNDGCDCGCGIPDPDCGGADSNACQYGCSPGQQIDSNDSTQCIINGVNGQRSEVYQRFIKRLPGDDTNTHFMAKPSALAFGQNGAFASIHEEDEITQWDTPWDFMGPTLWTTEFALFDSGHLSHIDMLHNTPNGMGIAWEAANAYWVYDGHHGSLTRYNFNQDHGPAGTDHSDGVVYRYVDGELGYQPGVPSHVAYDPTTELVYAADTANSRIVVLDAKTGQLGGSIEPNYDESVQRYVTGASMTTLINGSSIGLQKPSGLELHNGRLYVSDYQSSKIFAFTLSGELIDWLDTGLPSGSLKGLALDSDGTIFAIDATSQRIVRFSAR